MAKEMNCVNYFPGDVRHINGNVISDYLLRDGRKTKLINGFWLSGKGDNQRCTADMYYIYADDNLLGGK